VIQILVAEVYGPDLDGQTRVAQEIKSIFQHTPGVVDIDWYVEDPQPRLAVQVDSVWQETCTGRLLIARCL